MGCGDLLKTGTTNYHTGEGVLSKSYHKTSLLGFFLLECLPGCCKPLTVFQSPTKLVLIASSYFLHVSVEKWEPGTHSLQFAKYFFLTIKLAMTKCEISRGFWETGTITSIGDCWERSLHVCVHVCVCTYVSVIHMYTHICIPVYMYLYMCIYTEIIYIWKDLKYWYHLT